MSKLSQEKLCFVSYASWKFLLEIEEEAEEEDKTGIFIAKISRLTGTLMYVYLCFCELLDNVSRSAALLLAFVAYLHVLYYGQKPNFQWPKELRWYLLIIHQVATTPQV